MKENNQGLTLVELIVSMAILLVVGTGILGFFSYSLAQYQKSNDETNLQYESQLCVNRIREQVLQTNAAISTQGSGKVLYLYQIRDDGTKQRTTLRLDENKHQLIYEEAIWQDQGGWVIQGNGQPFAAYVTKWNVLLYDETQGAITEGNTKAVVPKKMVLDIEFEVGGRTYTTQERIALRNQIVASDDVSKIY